jgi:hypothetical protein
MQRRTITLEGRGDICARSTCFGAGCLGLDDDPELDFEAALLDALEAEEILAGSGAVTGSGGAQR